MCIIIIIIAELKKITFFTSVYELSENSSVFILHLTYM